MDRIGWIVVAVIFSAGMLGIWGCEQAAQTSSTAATPPVAGGSPQAQAGQIVLQGLADPDPQIRANAVEVVATTGEIRLMPRVQRMLADPAIPVRFLAILAMGDLQYALAKNDVAPLLRDPNPNIQIAAAYALGRLGQPEHYQVIREALDSSDQTVRANAALLLGKSGQKDAIRFLYWTLQRQDSADKVVFQAAESIAMLGDERIYPKLWTRLISAYADDRVIGIRAMGALGTEQAKNALVTMLGDRVVEVRLAAAEQLGKLGEPIGEAEVTEVFGNNLMADMDPDEQQRVKVFAALAIGEIGAESPAKHLPQLLQDPSPRVRLAAAKAVLRLRAK